MPPLPHHRAYGSVPRRFGGLSTGQLFHGNQAQTTEASFGEGAMQSFREAQPPRSLGAEDGRTGRPFGDLEPTELTIALASRLPLDPGDATQAPSDPAIRRWQLMPLAEAEVNLNCASRVTDLPFFGSGGHARKGCRHRKPAPPCLRRRPLRKAMASTRNHTRRDERKSVSVRACRRARRPSPSCWALF